MPPDDKALTEKYDLVKLSVISSSQISNRATAIISKLGSGSGTNRKATVVALRAKSRDANKLISIAEIAKRELKASGTSCFQYNALASERIEIERKFDFSASDGDISKATGNGDDSDGADAFQTMPSETNTGLKERLMPVMIIYLSAVPIRELKTAYG